MHGGTAAIIDRFYDAWSRKMLRRFANRSRRTGGTPIRWHVATSSASN
jgi:hypothetical protein